MNRTQPAQAGGKCCSSVELHVVVVSSRSCSGARLLTPNSSRTASRSPQPGLVCRAWARVGSGGAEVRHRRGSSKGDDFAGSLHHHLLSSLWCSSGSRIGSDMPVLNVRRDFTALFYFYDSGSTQRFDPSVTRLLWQQERTAFTMSHNV